MADLNWEAPQYRRALTDIVQADLIMHDPATAETYVQKWFQHKGNIPTNKDHAKGTMKIIEKIDSDVIREKVMADFMETDWAIRTFADQPANDAPDGLSHSQGLLSTRLMQQARGNR
ncbi:hypothetical protein NKH14_22605 [Mesorhizobium sp. M1380]|uniref:hypothetical protein n=1 Tax=Mesorhizobium sp. M1380 TaxID=2957093 RepID=UPI0033355052